MKKKIYWIRHGQTDWNKQGLWQGHKNNPLNDTGLTQAKKIAPKLKDLGIESIFASDLKRVEQTHNLAFEGSGLKVFTDSRLREAHAGQADGTDIETRKLRFGKDCMLRWSSHKESDLDYRFPEGRKQEGSCCESSESSRRLCT